MSDDKPFDNKEETVQLNLEALKRIKDSEHLTIPERKAAVSRALPKVAGRWNELQSILIDIEVGYRVKVAAGTLDKVPPLTVMVLDVEAEIKDRYKDNIDHRDILLFNLPSRQAAGKWVLRPEWKEEVEKRLKDGNLFSLDKRAAMIESLYRKGITGDNKSAEMWLKMSGDLSNQPVTKDKALDSFKQLSESLFNGDK